LIEKRVGRPQWPARVVPMDLVVWVEALLNPRVGESEFGKAPTHRTNHDPVISLTNAKNAFFRGLEMPQFTGTLW